jgi:hypothetical protein
VCPLESISLLFVITDWNSLLSRLVGAVVGGVIAAVSTMWAASRGATKAFEYSQTLQKGAEDEATRRFLRAIQAEIETIWSGYQSEIGDRFQAMSVEKGFPLNYRLGRNSFTVYDSNAQFWVTSKMMPCAAR